MYRHKPFLYVTALLSIVLFTAVAFLARSGEIPAMAAQAAPAYTVITTDTTWNTSQTFETDVVVQDGATLTIAGDTVTTFSNVANDAYPDGLSAKNELIVEAGGRLVVQPGARLTGMGSAGDWYGVVFAAGSDGEIDDATIEKGVAGVTIIDASPSVLNNLIQDMQGGGSSVGTLGAGIIVSGTSTSRIEGNFLTTIRGANGVSGDSESGDDGWPAAPAVGIYIHGATPNVSANTISSVSAGRGGSGGGGQPGTDGAAGVDGGAGGDGGDGGLGGRAWGIRVEGPTAATAWRIANNIIQSVSANWSGSGGDSGTGGEGGAGASGTIGASGGHGGDAGNPGDGASGLPAYGVYVKNASPTLQDNLIRHVFGGGGGWAGSSDAGDGGVGGDGTTGVGGDGGDGGDSCTEPATAGDGAAAYGIFIEGTSSSDVRHNTIYDVEGGEGGWSTRCKVGYGGNGGDGTSNGLGGDSGAIQYTSLGHSGHGGNAFGIQVLSATPTVACNTVYDIQGGDSDMTWSGASIKAGTPGGQSSNAGPGADGGNGGNAFGIYTNSTLRIENNVVHAVGGGQAEGGSKGGSVFYSSVTANGGDGGEGGNGGSGWGIYADGADPVIVNNTVVDVSLESGGSAGDGGSGDGGGADGAAGGDGIPGRADGIFMDNGARPPTIYNVVAQMSGATGYGISSRTAQSGFELDYNLLWNWPSGNYNPSLIPGSHDVEADPLFVDWAGDNFYLQPTSPAIDQGVGSSAVIPTDDHDGVSRPRDGDGDGSATGDIGAYEYITGTASLAVTTAAGSWTSADGRLGLAWADGAVTGTVTLTYTPRGLLHPVHSLTFGAVGFNLVASEPVTFSPPLSLTLYYDDADVAGLDEGSLNVYTWDTVANQWSSLTVLARDAVANAITVRLEHLSDFALLGSTSNKIYLPLIVRDPTP